MKFKILILSFVIAFNLGVQNVYTQSVNTAGLSSYYICPDGNVFAWGLNKFNLLGDGTGISRNYPDKIPVLEDIVSLSVKNIAGCSANSSCERCNSLALKSDGTVWIWGFDYKDLPVPINELQNIVDISDGYSHFACLKSDGTVWTWGCNYYGQLGDGTTTDSQTPVQVVGLDDVVSIMAGNHSTYALKSDGTVWAWGENNVGQIGDNTSTNRLTPVKVEGLNDVISIITGYSSAYALKSDGTVWSWGYNLYGQLGDGTDTNRKIPVQVVGLEDVALIDAGHYDFAYAVKKDGTLWAWGNNSGRMLADGTSDNSFIPVKSIVFENIFIAELATNWSHILVKDEEGNLYSWGSNSLGQLGDGTNTDCYDDPIRITLLSKPEGPINGSLNPEMGSVQTYFIPGNDSVEKYKWVVPDTWNMISGDDDALIEVIAGTIDGQLCVSYNNSCKYLCINVYPQFTVLDIGEDTILCNGDTLLLVISEIPDAKYLWNTGDTTSYISITESGNYYLQMFMNDTILKDSIKVIFAPRPTVYIGPDSAFCGEINHLLDPISDAKYFKWNTGDTTRTLYINESGLYSLLVKNDLMCKNADTVLIKQIELPYSNLGHQLEVCSTTFMLDAGNPGSDFLWNTGETTQQINVSQSGIYSVKIYNGYCKITDSVEVQLIADNCEFYLWLPNAFSPNNDGLNEFFKPVVNNELIDFHMRIYDRWGELIFKTNEVEKGWDGKWKGKTLPEGVYIYIIYYEYKDRDFIRSNNIHGSLNLIY